MRSATESARLVGVAVVVVGLDQWAKSIAESDLVRGERRDLIGPLDLTLTYNDGIAFGLAGGAGPLVIFLGLVALAALALFVRAAPPGWPTVVAGGLILGGALGNLIDRITAGEVTDFLLLPHWPAFNLADVAITTGVIALGIIVVRGGGRE